MLGDIKYPQHSCTCLPNSIFRDGQCIDCPNPIEAGNKAQNFRVSLNEDRALNSGCTCRPVEIYICGGACSLCSDTNVAAVKMRDYVNVQKPDSTQDLLTVDHKQLAILQHAELFYRGWLILEHHSIAKAFPEIIKALDDIRDAEPK